MSDNATVSANASARTPQDRATFYGVHYREVTGRNQVAIPKQFKRAMEEAQEGQLLVMRWQKEPFLRLYTKKQFDKKLDEVKSNPGLSLEQRALSAAWMAKAAEPVEPDSQGRFVLPAKWIEALGFKDEVAFCGAFTFIEVWPADVHRETEKAEPKELAPLGAALTSILNM
ncbi:MAG: hypothetical protein NTW87_12660 [Planctomycetota bacterium]|nr:hypothetical protein [Planctomycetota bacterium]